MPRIVTDVEHIQMLLLAFPGKVLLLQVHSGCCAVWYAVVAGLLLAIWSRVMLMALGSTLNLVSAFHCFSRLLVCTVLRVLVVAVACSVP